MKGYFEIRRIRYNGGATFIPVCEKCGRFVKGYEKININESIGLKDEPNCDCSKCGRSKMIFEGFMDEYGEPK